MTRRSVVVGLAGGVLLLLSSPAFANAGLPMIGVTIPWMLISLIPVILIEAAVIRKIASASPARALGAAGSGNIASMVFGAPATWFLLVLIQMLTGGGSAYGVDTVLQRFLAVTWQAAWLIPYEEHFNWMIPAAVMVLLIPYFFASWLIEYWIARAVLKDIDKAVVKRAVFAANAITYGLMEAVVFGLGVWGAVSER